MAHRSDLQLQGVAFEPEVPHDGAPAVAGDEERDRDGIDRVGADVHLLLAVDRRPGAKRTPFER